MNEWATNGVCVCVCAMRYSFCIRWLGATIWVTYRAWNVCTYIFLNFVRIYMENNKQASISVRRQTKTKEHDFFYFFFSLWVKQKHYPIHLIITAKQNSIFFLWFLNDEFSLCLSLCMGHSKHIGRQ